MMWVNRKGRYPFVDEQVWITRCWLLIRKVDRQRGVTSYSDRRVAVELLAVGRDRRGRPVGPKHLVPYLEEIICGSAEERPYSPAPPEEGMGQER